MSHVLYEANATPDMRAIENQYPTMTLDEIKALPVPAACYLLPFPLLRRAWRQNHAGWVSRYFQVRADNGQYWTCSVAVPIPVVLGAVSGACLVRFTTLDEAA